MLTSYEKKVLFILLCILITFICIMFFSPPKEPCESDITEKLKTSVLLKLKNRGLSKYTVVYVKGDKYYFKWTNGLWYKL